MVVSKIFCLDPEVSREDFDRVFDAHWHSAFLIRHLIYSRSRGEDLDEPFSATPKKSLSLISDMTPLRRKNTLKKRLRAVDTDTDDETY